MSLYWDLLASGLGTVEACRQVGIGRRTGLRWRRENGGFRRDPGGVDPVQGRYLSLFERERIQILTAQDVGVREIARRLGRSPSTISRELRRVECTGSRGAAYDAGSAHQHAAQLARRQRRSKLASDEWLHDFVQDKLEQEWSPEQISGFLGMHHPEHAVSSETIYQGLYLPHRSALRRDLAKKLRTGRTLRQPRRRKNKRATRYIDPGRLIDEPARGSRGRVTAGHWEGDLITGSYNATAIGTLVERTSGYAQLVDLPIDHTAGNVCPAVAATMTLLPSSMRRSLTWDQGAEMAEHATVTGVLSDGVFFAMPASPWQRGSNENVNGLLRQYFPKSTDPTIHDAGDLRVVEDRLNNRPRKRHGWKTPAEVYAQHVQNSGSTVATTG